MTDAARVVRLRRIGAPAAAAASREKLPAPEPTLIQASRAGYLLKSKHVSKHQQIVAGHSVGGDHGVRVHEGIMLHNPECRMVLRLDGVIANKLEKRLPVISKPLLALSLQAASVRQLPLSVARIPL